MTKCDHHANSLVEHHPIEVSLRVIHGTLRSNDEVLLVSFLVRRLYPACVDIVVLLFLVPKPYIRQPHSGLVVRLHVTVDVLVWKVFDELLVRKIEGVERIELFFNVLFSCLDQRKETFWSFHQAEMIRHLGDIERGVALVEFS